MEKKTKRRNYFELTYKEKQMVNNIMLEKEGKYTPFSIVLFSVYAFALIICMTQKLVIHLFLLIPIMFIAIRLRLYYYYKTHPEINFDKDKENYQKIEEKTDRQMALGKFAVAIFGVVIVIGIMGICGAFDNNDTGGISDNSYKTNCYTRSDGKRCCTSCKKTSYGDVGCSTTCN